MPLNAMERRIVEGAKQAHREYYRLSNEWLDHAPEFFLTTMVARELGRGVMKYWVYLDASPKKIKDEMEHVSPGQPAKNNQFRFDLVVWWKNNLPRAVIEVKRAWAIAPLLKDKKKIIGFLKQKQAKGAKRGYLLVYSEAREKKGKKGSGKNTLCNRFNNFATQLKAELAGAPHIETPLNNHWEEKYSWGIALYRIKKS